MSNFVTKDFEPTSASAWKQKIQFDLKGADYNKTLLTNTNEGITIKPFYHLDTFEKLPISETETNFKVCQKIVISSEKEANIIAVKAINNGVNALKFIAKKPFDSSVLFENCLQKQCEFHFQLHFLSEEFITQLTQALKNEAVYLNIDIIGNLVQTGNWFTSLKHDFKTVETILKTTKCNFPLAVNTAIYQNAGANIVQQIAYALAHTNEYLTNFGEHIANKIQFNFAIGSNYFFEIAKLRAFNYLYNLILTQYNTTAKPAIYTEPTLRNKTIYDYNVNMLRTTTESMSGILGGASTIANCAYDNLFHQSNEFGDRIAKNQLLILKEESYFKNANLIASNSYYIEAITKQLAEKALEIFKEIEKGGGFLQQLKKGTIQRKIKESAEKEQQQFNLGELILLGTNKYPNEKDKMKLELQLNPFQQKNAKKTLIVPVLQKRLAEEIEQKRLNNET